MARDALRINFCFRSLHIAAIFWNYISSSLGSLLLSRHKYTVMVGQVGFLVYLAAPLVGFLGCSSLKDDLTALVKKNK